MNRGELRSTASKFVHRKDIPWDDIDPLACADMNVTLIVQENEASASVPLSLPLGNALYWASLPADYCRMRSVWLNGIIEPVDIKTLQEFGGSKYAISGGRIYTYGGGAVDLVYSARIEPLTSDIATNAVSENFPNVYLYALLKHAAIFMQDAELNGEFFEQQFLNAATTANSDYANATFGPGMAAIPMGGLV